MSLPSTPSESAVASPSAPPAPAPSHRNRLGLILGAVIAAALLVLLLLLAGVIPGITSSGGGTSPGSNGVGLTYDQALPLANQATNGVSGGPWALIAASGLISAQAISENLSSASSGTSDCNVTPFAGGPSTVTLPAGPANQTGGTGLAWFFLYRDVATTVLIVGAVEGAAAAYATVAAGQSCSTIFALLSVVPSVVDSSAAAAAVKSDAASFLESHTVVRAGYGLVGGLSLFGHGIGAEWEVNYTSCAPNPSPGAVGSAFNASVNATTGTVLYSHTWGSVVCPAGTSLSLAHPRTSESAAHAVVAARRP